MAFFGILLIAVLVAFATSPRGSRVRHIVGIVLGAYAFGIFVVVLAAMGS